MHALLNCTTEYSIKQVLLIGLLTTLIICIKVFTSNLFTRLFRYQQFLFFIFKNHYHLTVKNKFRISENLFKGAILCSQRNTTANIPLSGLTCCPFIDWMVASLPSLMTLMTIVLISSTSLLLLWSFRSSVREKYTSSGVFL